MRAVYAFCRVIDDIADEPGALADKHAALAQWRVWTRNLSTSTDPVAQELLWAQREFDVPLGPMGELIDGVSWDVEGRVPDTWEALERYCYGVAGTVGLLCLPIFGVPLSPTVERGAITLGFAFQLTNILRDVASDARQHRCYLPTAWLAAHDISRDDLRMAANGDVDRQQRSITALREALAKTEAAYRAAWQVFPIAEYPQMEPARIMSYCYYRLLQQMTADPLVIFRRRVSLGVGAKMRVLLRSMTGRGWLNAWFT